MGIDVGDLQPVKCLEGWIMEGMGGLGIDRAIKAETHDATNCCDTSLQQVSSPALLLQQVVVIRYLFGARNRF